MSSAVSRADVVFHAAAMKQVPTCEYFPCEAMATNVRGADNVVRAVRALNPHVETWSASPPTRPASPST